MWESELLKCGEKHENLAFSKTVVLKWWKPTPGVGKLNTDGSMNPINGRFGGDGVIRKSDGNWLYGFFANFGFGTVLKVEAEALYVGLTIASELHLTSLEIETDSSILVLLVKDSAKLVVSEQLRQTIINCQNLLKSFQHYIFEHVYREQNIMVDKLAAKDCEQEGLHKFGCPPDFFTDALENDLCGKTTPRQMGKAKNGRKKT
ncbi:PREDICTED: uncharacterized protein LOC101315367 [Fragaria vesca subsp. vesca]|uniref:uncharacterized protein LOC101315367 n=1 Tax=Fragaria vesca subsp. vesca TaxID=101020 RepID=UPI0002C30DC8|nr:PREDICTED: uncharacterized protein LOC101315367 [Fragaria vesca subsp. vesca]